MNRSEYMSRLKELLADVTEAEREEALSYYEEYFDDAGAENEESVIASLGSPEKVAATIKAGLNENAAEEGEFSENGYTNSYYDTKDEIAERISNGGEKGFTKRRGIGTGGWIIILILCIFALPILGPLLIGIASAVFGILIAIAAVFFAVLIVGVAMIVAAVAMFAAAIGSFITAPILGIALVGAALLVGGLGIVVTVLGAWIVTKVVPPMFRGFVNLIRKPFTRKGV